MAVVAVIAGAVAVAGPWFGHLGLPWPGGGSGGGQGSAAVRVLGADAAWHREPVSLRFVDHEGASITVQWRVDGGPWQTARNARIAAPANHSNDGEHVVQARPAPASGDATTGSSAGVATARVRIDTTPPEVRAVSVAPNYIHGPATVRLAFDAPAGQGGVTVSWAMIDTLGEPVGEQGQPELAAGARAIAWAARAASGALFPGTYRLRVTAADAAGNQTMVYAPLAFERPAAAKLYRSLPKAGKLVGLTFDGGSGYAWRHIMMVLTRLHAHGTFFCTGVSVSHYPEVAKEAVAQGMTLGNHSFDHPNFTTISYQEARRQLLANAAAWWKACRATPAPFFRPPYGAYNATTLKAAGSAGYPFVVNWDVDTADWAGASPAVIASRAVAGAHPGSIICMHTEWNSQKAIPAIVAGLRKKGLEPVGLDKMFRAAGLL
jgi:peptidoglycan/xylan/chitin deacetylase (PgdA/CDA1 family)